MSKDSQPEIIMAERAEPAPQTATLGGTAAHNDTKLDDEIQPAGPPLLVHEDDVPAIQDKIFAEVLVSQYDHLTRGQVLRKCWVLAIYAGMVGFGAVFDGYQGMPSGLIANEGFIKTMGTVNDPETGKLAIDVFVISAWGGVSNGVNAFSAVLGGFVSDWYGRKFNMGCMIVFLMIATIIGMTSNNWKTWCLQRTFLAMGNGFSQSVLLTYISEISPKQVRGGFISSYAVVTGIGQLFGSLALEILQQTPQREEWRRVIYSEWILTGIFTIFFFFLPESPWYYANKGMAEKAKKSLKRLHANVKDYDVDREYAVLQSEIEAEKAIHAMQGGGTWFDLFKGVNRRRTFISCFPPMLYNIVGSTIMFGYTTYFFALAGLEDPFLGSLILTISLIVTETIALYTTDSVGRRPLALGAITGFTLSLLGIGILGLYPISKATSNSLMAMAIIWVVSYGSGWAPTMQTFIGETSTPRLRAKTTALAQGCGQAFGLIWTYCTPMMLSNQQANWGVKTGFCFSITSFLGLIAYFFFMPELNRRSYAELDELFEKRIPARRFKSTKTSAQLQLEGSQAMDV